MIKLFSLLFEILLKATFFVIAPTLALMATTHSALFSGDENEMTISRSTIILVFYLVVMIIFFIFNQFADREKKYKNKIMNLKAEIEDNKKDLKDQARGLWKELKFLNKYKEKEVISSVLEQFIKRHSEVVAAQIYEYHQQKTGIMNKETNIKLTYVEGCIKEGENQNALVQAYYRIPSITLDFFLRVRALLRESDKSPSKTVQQFATRSAMVFSKRNIRILNKKADYELNKSDVFRFSLLQLMLDELGLENQIQIKNENILHNLQKNGILRGILDDGEFYRFTYKKHIEGQNEKASRHYLTKKVIVNGLQHILVITVNSDVESDELEKIGNKLINQLVASDLTVEYNKRK